MTEYIMNWHKLAKYVDDINTLNGFDKPTWDNLPVKVMMVVTELDELQAAFPGYTNRYMHDDSESLLVLYEEDTEGQGGDIEEEIADVAIRLLSLLHSIWGESWPRPRKSHEHFSGEISKSLWPIVHFLCEGVELWRYDKRKKTKSCLTKALSKVWGLADSWGFDLKKLIKRKADINKERGHLHGKVRSAG